MKINKISVQSPGRINLIGEHIDYNDGFVLPAAINKNNTFHLIKNGSKSTATITAKNVQEHYSFDLNNFQPIENGWQNYVMGVVHELQLLGAQIGGFNAEFSGDVPIGGGMSSSAALECSLAFGLNELFQLGLDKWQLIKAAQLAEHNFVGIKCGIMDQFASMMGKKNQVMLLDCRSLEFDYFPLELGEYELLLLNTNVSHNLASSAYNTRRQEAEQGLAIISEIHPEISSWREVTASIWAENKSKMPTNVRQRCRHILSEMQRVLAATTALQNHNFKQLGSLIYQSHESLSKDYAVSCPELDFLVQLTFDKPDVLGSRMMGGGFGGCTLNIIHQNYTKQFIDLAQQSYHKQFGIELTPYTVTIENGTAIV